MNWGKGIVITLIVFVLFISGMSLWFFLMPVDDYDHQYYEKGLTFNNDFDREMQVAKDKAAPSITVEDKVIKIAFTKPVDGTIKFMRPSDTSLDKAFKLNSGIETIVTFPLQLLPKGEWQIEMDWKSNKKAYLYHKGFYIK